MSLNLKEPRVGDWLNQLDPKDQLIARRLLENIHAIDATQLATGLRTQILALAARSPGPVALYAERHIRHRKGKPNRLFKETRTKKRRAFGHGPPPVPQGRPYSRETGSEGLIATLITGLARAHPNRFIDHPGPKVLRDRRVRTYAVVTDFIGSGRRACANLEGAWQIRSFKSWRSSGHLRFAVAAYSGTRNGCKKVETHRSRPEVLLHCGCPVIDDIAPDERRMIIELCERFAPSKLNVDSTALGYGDGGALMVFDHGIPNNAPLLLHTAKSKWVPLFPRRSSAVFDQLKAAPLRRCEIDRSLKNLRNSSLAEAPRFGEIEDEEQELMLLLTALKRRPRTIIALSARTWLPITVVEDLLQKAQADGYLDSKLRPTIAAYNALNYLKSTDLPPAKLPKTQTTLYCPNSLRPPC